MSIRKSDIIDADIIDAYEIASDGYAGYLDTTLVSTDFTLQKIIINAALDGEGILYSMDHPVESGDRVLLVGTSGGAADGYFVVDTVLDDLSFTVTTSIANSTGGTIYFMYPTGASRIGFDSNGLTSTNANNLQDAIKDIGFAADNAVNYNQHETLRQLIHFIDEGPATGFASGAFKKTIGQPFPTSVTWYEDYTEAKKIVEKLIVRNSAKNPTSITWNMYATDGTTIIHTITDAITYISSSFEFTRTRTIS